MLSLNNIIGKYLTVGTVALAGALLPSEALYAQTFGPLRTFAIEKGAHWVKQRTGSAAQDVQITFDENRFFEVGPQYCTVTSVHNASAGEVSTNGITHIHYSAFEQLLSPGTPVLSGNTLSLELQLRVEQLDLYTGNQKQTVTGKSNLNLTCNYNI